MGSHRRLCRSARSLRDEGHDHGPLAASSRPLGPVADGVSVPPHAVPGERLITLAMRRPPRPGDSDVPDPQVRLRCQAAIASLAVPCPFSLEAFRTSLEGQRHRPLELAAAAMPPACTGLWIATERADYIFYEQDAAPDDQLKIIFHEIGHMALNHQGIPITSRVIALLFPHLDPCMVAAALAGAVSSTVYSETEELEADTFTNLFLEMVRDSS